MPIKIALAGNPNCGKTTMFNDLTGSSQYVGNWPGVTVEKKEGRLKGNKDVIITDLPGIYSLSPYTLEEVVSRKYLTQEKPDAILNLVDATNLERNLYLTTQILELGIPVVVALNMMDLVRKNGDRIDTAKLSAALGCEVVETSALKGQGSLEAAERAVALARLDAWTAPQHRFDGPVEEAIGRIEELLADCVDSRQARWYAVKLFERDAQVGGQLGLDAGRSERIEALTAAVESSLDDDAESLVTNERYTYIAGLIQHCVHKKQRAMTTSDKIDRVVTNRWLALPIFAMVMFIVYFVSVTTVGTLATDWANDGVFGDGWHLLGIGSGAYEQAAEAYEKEGAKVEAYLAAAEEAGIDVAALAETLGTEEPDGAVIDAFLAQAEAVQLTATVEIENEDGAVEETLPVALDDFTAALSAEEPDPAAYGVWVPGIPVLIGNGLEAANSPAWLSSLILDGIVGGVGAVLGFVPQMFILFFFLAILEDCGYMARVAFIMDRIFRKFGLSGKSFIPMLISSGCGVPGIMATKTIENEKDRRMTIMTTTFIPCGAKLPVIALIGGAIFPAVVWMAPAMYFLGILVVILSGIILKKTRMFAGDPAPFVMELPQYHIPAPKGVLLHMWERGKAFIVKAGTVIFLACGLIWFLSSFGFTAEGFGMVEESASMLAVFGGWIAPIFAPLGFGNWQATVATLSGLIAKENVVGTFGVLFGLGSGVAEDDPNLLMQIGAMFPYAAAAMSFLVFNLLCAPCFAAIGAIKREMASVKWTWFAIGYQTVLAYAAALMINQFGGLIFGGVHFGIGTIAAVLVLALLLFLLFRPNPQKRRKTSRAAARATA